MSLYVWLISTNIELVISHILTDKTRLNRVKKLLNFFKLSASNISDAILRYYNSFNFFRFKSLFGFIKKYIF